MFKKSKVILALALVAMMCFASIPSAFAAPDDPAQPTPYAAITKLLKIPYGTTVPTADFIFKVTSLGVDGDPTVDAPTADIGGSGVGGDITISFPPEGDPPKYTYVDQVDNIMYYYLESDELFGDVTWPDAGVYKYKIVETDYVYTTVDGEHTEKSDAEYHVYVYVDYNKDTGKLEITHIGVLMVIGDDGEDIDENDQEKVDPTPGGDPEKEYYTSQLIFTNEFWKTIKPIDPDAGESTLEISKVVKGNNAAKGLYFEFNMTITVPDLIGVAETYKAYVVEEDPDNPGVYINVTAEVNGAKTGDDFIEFTTKKDTTFYLKHGQKLLFVDTPVGTSYVITEAAHPDYAPEVEVVYDSGTPETTSALKGAPLALPNDDIKADLLYVGEKINYAAFTNDRGTTSPTGLNLNDLPFYGLILLAIGGFVTFVVVQTRKRKNYNR